MTKSKSQILCSRSSQASKKSTSLIWTQRIFQTLTSQMCQTQRSTRRPMTSLKPWRRNQMWIQRLILWSSKLQKPLRATILSCRTSSRPTRKMLTRLRGTTIRRSSSLMSKRPRERLSSTRCSTDTSRVCNGYSITTTEELLTGDGIILTITHPWSQIWEPILWKISWEETIRSLLSRLTLTVMPIQNLTHHSSSCCAFSLWRVWEHSCLHSTSLWQKVS